MPTTINVSLRAYAALPTGLSIFLYDGEDLLNTGGDTLTHLGNGYFSASIAETIANVDYDVVIVRSGNGIADGVLFAGQTVVGVEGATSADVTSIAGTPVAVDTGGSGIVSFVSDAYVATAGGTVNANIVQVGGEDIHDDGEGRMEVIADPSGSIAVVSIPAIEYASLIEPYEKMVRYRGTAWSIAVEGLASIPAKCFFTMKRSVESDASSVIQIVKSNPLDGALDGLKILNGAIASNRSNGSIAFSSYTVSGQTRYRATMTIAAEATSAFRVRDYRFDFKDVATDTVLAEGELRVVAPVTASTS